jgi:hypothetical protein
MGVVAVEAEVLAVVADDVDAADAVAVASPLRLAVIDPNAPPW